MPIGWKGFDLSYNLYEKKSYQLWSTISSTDSGQKYSNASDFPYIFHIKLRFFK